MEGLFKFTQPYEPKKENRFIVKLPEEINIPSWMIKETERPKFRTNGYHLVPEEIKLVLFDPISPSTTQAVWEFLTGLTDIEAGRQILPELKAKYQKKFNQFNDGFDYTLEILGPVGDVVEKWEISKAKMTKIDFGNLDWGNDKPCLITLWVQPAKVTLLF